MKAVIQVVKNSSIVINGKQGGRTQKGLVVLVAYREEDNDATVEFFVNKLVNLRIFPDADGKLNLSVKDVGGSVMLVSNFTLYGDASKGRRPSYSLSAKPEISKPLYIKTLEALKKEIPVVEGEFGADMQVELINDGPITVILEA